MDTGALPLISLKTPVLFPTNSLRFHASSSESREQVRLDLFSRLSSFHLVCPIRSEGSVVNARGYQKIEPQVTFQLPAFAALVHPAFFSQLPRRKFCASFFPLSISAEHIDWASYSDLLGSECNLNTMRWLSRSGGFGSDFSFLLIRHLCKRK